jgi:hypothetical protein
MKKVAPSNARAHQRRASGTPTFSFISRALGRDRRRRFDGSGDEGVGTPLV